MQNEIDKIKEEIKEDIKIEREFEQWLKKICALSTQALIVFILVWAAMTLLNYVEILQGNVPHKFIFVVNGSIFSTSVSSYLIYKYIRRRRRRLNEKLRN